MKLSTIIVSASLLLLFISCKKDKLEENTSADKTYDSLSDFYAENGVKTQTFTIDPAISQTVQGEKGVKLIISPNTFVQKDSAGSPPVGMVKIELKEILYPVEMVLSSMPTTSFGQILQSGGEVYINATDDAGNDLEVAGNLSQLNIIIPFVNLPVNGMDVFYGYPNTSTSINWITADSFSNASIKVIDSIGYSMLVDSLGYGWINCDDYYPTDSASLTVNLSNTTGEIQEDVTADVFLIMKDINSVLKMWNLTESPLPAGKEAVVASIGIGEKSKKLYFGKQKITLAKNQVVNLELVRKEAEDVKNELIKL